MRSHLLDMEPNVYNANCPSRQVLSRIGDKWSVMIVELLRQQPFRFGELKRACAGISQKMLTHTLRGLERDGLARRTILCTKPLQIEYALTPLGVALATQLQPLIHWVHTHYKHIEVIQRKYDGQQLLST